jgi:hypothetical protein
LPPLGGRARDRHPCAHRNPRLVLARLAQHIAASPGPSRCSPCHPRRWRASCAACHQLPAPLAGTSALTDAGGSQARRREAHLRHMMRFEEPDPRPPEGQKSRQPCARFSRRENPLALSIPAWPRQHRRAAGNNRRLCDTGRAHGPAMGAGCSGSVHWRRCCGTSRRERDHHDVPDRQEQEMSLGHALPYPSRRASFRGARRRDRASRTESLPVGRLRPCVGCAACADLRRCHRVVTNGRS